MIRFTLFVVGILLCVLAGAMLLPALVDVIVGQEDWRAFVGSSAMTGFFGLLLCLSTRDGNARFSVRAGFLITTASWIAVGLFGSLPLILASPRIGVTDAVFETFSALTTTGSTVLSGLDIMPPGLLFWRSLLQWLGGVGIVVMAIVILPFLRVGGMQLFRSESSDISEKAAPHLYQIAMVTASVYVGLTVMCAICLAIAGMTPFDAINHAMTTIATGGFSTRDASIGYYNSLPIEIILIVFMTAGALPLVFHARLLTKGHRALREERQVQAFLAILGTAIAAMTLWRYATGNVPLSTALRQSAFNVTSILTDTGFATTDFGTWGTGAQGMFLILMFIGGCAGSTSGAIKIFRWQLMGRTLVGQFRKTLSPHRVVVTRYGSRNVTDDMLSSVRTFFFMYLMTWGLLSLALMLLGLDLLSATSAVAQAMANAGPGLGPLVGPGTNFAAIPDPAKWLLALAMLLGRLEFTAVFILLVPDFWRR